MTRYLEATGNTAAVNTTNLVARVQGFLQEIKYKDGDLVKQGATLFVIEPEPYKLKLEQAQAAEAGAQAALKQAEADYERQTELAAARSPPRRRSTTRPPTATPPMPSSSRRKVDTSRPDQSRLHGGEGAVRRHRHGAPGVARRTGRRQRPTQLATIVQTAPIYVNFNINEQEVLQHSRRDPAARHHAGGAQESAGRGRAADRQRLSAPRHARLRLADRSTQSTGTLAVRAILQNRTACCCRAISCACASPPTSRILAGPDAALGSDQGGRYVLVVNKDNVVEQRKVEVGPTVGDLRAIESGLKADERVVVAGILRAIPGQKVDPQMQTARGGARPRGASSGRRMISKFFIERPVLANVLAILMVVIGVVALFALPVAQYPDVVPPTVQVTTRYPGASARTVVDAVALPIEQQVNGVEGMIYMQSFSGRRRHLYADGDVQDRRRPQCGAGAGAEPGSSALSSLPQAVQAQGVIVQKNSTAILQIVTLASPDARYDSLYLANYATIQLKDEIARLPGVGNVVVFGAGQYAMRIWLDPNKMKARGLMPRT